MSKILLIKPRFFTGFWLQECITQPMGLLYIGATLIREGHEVKIHDCGSDHKELNLLRQTIDDWKPEFIGLSIIITELEETARVMGVIRGVMPDVPVIFGGPWPSANPKESINTFNADYVVLGEGELVLPRLIGAVNKGLPAESIPGTASVNNGAIKINPRVILTEDELNALPFPAWELLDHELYARAPSMIGVGRRYYMSIVTSRGCPYRCAYCHQTMGKVFRKRSAESVIAEMERLRFTYGFKEFEILDDCFNLDRKRMHAILIGIKDRLGDARLHFPNAVRSDILELEDIDLLKHGGTVSICFAIETATPRLQKMVRKNLDIEKASRAIDASVKAGIYSTGYFIIGFPTETYQEAINTVKFAAHSSLHRALFFNPIPYAGTEMAEMVSEIIQEQDLTDPRMMSYHISRLNISAMTDQELHKITRGAYRRFYLNPQRIFRVIKLILIHPELFTIKRFAAMFINTFFRGKE